MLENQTLRAIVLIKKQYRVFEESKSANFCRLRLLKPQKCPDSDSPALFLHKLISAGLPPCFVRWTQSFIFDRRACMVYQNHKSRFFQILRGVPQGSVLGPVLLSLLINDLRASLPSSVCCSLYADDLAIWSSSPSVPTAVEATQGALFQLER